MATGFVDVYNRNYNGFEVTLHVFDWSTMASERKVFTTSNSYPESYPICTTYTDDDNKVKVVYTTGRGSFSYFDLEDLSSQTRLTELPTNMKRSLENSFGQLVATNSKTELLHYGGQSGEEILDGIYKYSLATKLWTKVGTMIHPRASHAVLPVQGLSCP